MLQNQYVKYFNFDNLLLSFFFHWILKTNFFYCFSKTVRTNYLVHIKGRFYVWCSQFAYSTATARWQQQIDGRSNQYPRYWGTLFMQILTFVMKRANNANVIKMLIKTIKKIFGGSCKLWRRFALIQKPALFYNYCYLLILYESPNNAFLYTCKQSIGWYHPSVCLPHCAR